MLTAIIIFLSGQLFGHIPPFLVKTENSYVHIKLLDHLESRSSRNVGELEGESRGAEVKRNGTCRTRKGCVSETGKHSPDFRV